MPKARRETKVSLTKVRKAGQKNKKKIVNDAKKYLELFSRAVILELENANSLHTNYLRERLSPGHLFLGKHRLVRVGLGKDETDELFKGSHLISKHMESGSGVGSGIASETQHKIRCLLFTDSQTNDVKTILEAYNPEEYARAGAVATKTIVLKIEDEPLKSLDSSLEPRLRHLGVQSQLSNGVIILKKAYTVCTEGQPITSEQSKVMKHLEIRMSKFHARIFAVWDKETGKIVI